MFYPFRLYPLALTLNFIICAFAINTSHALGGLRHTGTLAVRVRTLSQTLKFKQTINVRNVHSERISVERKCLVNLTVIS